MQIRSSGDRTDSQIAYRRISPPTGLDPYMHVRAVWAYQVALAIVVANAAITFGLLKLVP